MSISSFFSSLVAGTLHADAPEESKVSEVESQEEVAGEAEAAQEEEEEPEDVRFTFPRVRFSLLSLDAHEDPSPVARRGTRVAQVQNCHSALPPLPRKSSIRKGI
jgi:hypothetical protein